MPIWKSVGRDIKDMMGSGSSVHTGGGGRGAGGRTKGRTLDTPF